MTKRAVVLALALAATGCGGHKKPASRAQTPAPSATATAAKTASADCQQLLTLRSQVEQALLAGRIDSSMPRSLSPLAEKAPAEIRPDARKIAVAYKQVRRALAQGEPPGQVLGQLDAPELTAATERINRWAAANC